MREGAEKPGARGKKWKASYDPKFKRQLLGLGKNISERVSEAIDDLLASENVRDPRDSKGWIRVNGAQHQVFTFRVGRSYRIMYYVRGDCICFLRVGDHKAVYGKG